MMAGLLWYRSYMGSLANTSGYYPDIHAGHADRVTELTLEAPYLIRETPAGYNQLELMELVGGTVAWNQLCNSSSVTGTSGHKFYLKKSGAESITNTNTFTGLASGTDMVIDLTLMLGSAIADYVYSLEQATAGSGVQWLKDYDLIDDAYHAFSDRTLQSVEATSHVSVGFNQFDKTTIDDGFIDNDTGNVGGTSTSKHSDYIPVFGGTSYYIKSDATSGRWGTWYDASKNYISGISGLGIKTAPANAAYMRMTVVYNGNGNPDTMCINISDPDRNGTYEAYIKRTCPTSPIPLRGILKTDENGNLYYDGDTYEWDGTVTRYYGTRAYQAGDESLTDAITDGTNTVYKLTTPTTESADPFTAVQTVEDGGTEEFVTTNNVPVGNVSIYRRV